MPFFLPSRLIDFEYFGGEPDEDYQKIAKPYQNEIDFAFFAVNLGYSKQEYEQLTPKEKIFIQKAWENKIVLDTTNIYRAVYTAEYNVNRSKRKKALKLWQKKKVNKANEELVKENINIIKENEIKEGKSWINKLYSKNNLNINK